MEKFKYHQARTVLLHLEWNKYTNNIEKTIQHFFKVVQNGQRFYKIVLHSSLSHQEESLTKEEFWPLYKRMNEDNDSTWYLELELKLL